jgi:hypothetical protein
MGLSVLDAESRIRHWSGPAAGTEAHAADRERECLEERLQVTVHRLKFNAHYPIDMKLQCYEPVVKFRAVACLTLDQHLSFLHIQQNPSLLNLSGCVNLPDKFGGALARHTR